jgi:RNA recognition motif-containing protein
MKDDQRNSKGFGFVSFKNADDAARATHLHTENGLYVQPFESKEERLSKKQREHLKFKKSQMYFNLFVKGMPEGTTDAEMTVFFS